MKNRKVFHYFVLFLIIFLCSYFWNIIELPYKDDKGSVGYLTELKYNHFNDTLRYLIFIILPLTYYVFFNYKYSKKDIINFKYFFSKFETEDKNFGLKQALPILIFLIGLLLIEFLSIRAPSKIFHVDHLHDGDYLTPAFNYLNTGQFWSSSFPIHGGSDIFYPLIAWKIFGIKSIGAFKVFKLFLIFLIKIFSVIFAFHITKFSTLETKYKLILFTLFSLTILSFSSYYSSSYLELRDLYALIFFIFFMQCFYKRERLLLNFLTTVVAVLTIFLHLDIGIYLCIVLFLYGLYLLISKKFKDFYQILAFFFATFLLVFLIIGKNEFTSFFEQTKHIILNIDKIHGLKYPQPFFSMGIEPDGSRATKAIIFQLISAIIVISVAFIKNNYFRINEKLFFLFLYLYSFVAFKNALGRSDGPHIMASSDWQSIIIGYFFINLIIYLYKKNTFVKLNIKNVQFLSILLVIGFTFFYMNFENIINFKSRYVKSIVAKDSQYLTLERNNMINLLKKELRNEECIQNFTIDLVIPYLIKKPTCTKYFSSWIASGYKVEQMYIKELREKKVRYVLYSSHYAAPLDDIDAATRLKYVDKFLLENYTKVFDVNDYRLIKLKD